MTKEQTSGNPETKLVALGVSSSIGIYKACEVLRGFQKEGLRVRAVMTANAARLISPLLFGALAGEDAIVDMFDERVTRNVGHVALAKEISLLCVAPATANVLAKFASGIADDFLSTLYLATNGPVLVAPAMNEAMYLHPATRENLRRLRSRGVEVIEPEHGYLACRDEGWGRLADPERIVAEGMRIIGRGDGWKGRRVLITAGPTREHLDPVRFLSNASSGKMGYELAREAAFRGAEVILVSGPSRLDPPPGVALVRVRTAAEMEAEVLSQFPASDIVIMAAAVSDFRFRETAPAKIAKKDVEARVELVRTPDILKKLGARKGKKILVGFAAQTGDAATGAARKLKEKNLDLIVANDVAEEGVGFESDENRVTIIRRGGAAFPTEKMSKRAISRIILDRIEEVIEKNK
jgi:phosphopantothenoylcysteine decarboxylase / phosphopantothenate---cysteine ligase